MLTVNHLVTASILVFLMALSPMSISMVHDRAPLVAPLNITDN